MKLKTVHFQLFVANHNVPCAVCHVSTMIIVLMIPAKNWHPSSWTLEYSGYLMSATSKSYYSDRRTRFECVDRNPDSVPGSAANIHGVVLTLWKPTAMAWHALHMTHRKNSLVLFVPNRTLD